MRGGGREEVGRRRGRRRRGRRRRVEMVGQGRAGKERREEG
jgi:hypothetical protein